MNLSSKNSLNFSPQEDLPKQKISGFLIRLLLEHPLCLTAVILFSIGAAVSELLSIALLMPFVESLRGSSSSSLSEQLPMISFLVPYFEGLSLVSKIRLIAVSLLVVELAKGLSRFISGLFSNRLQFQVEASLQLRVMDQLMKAGMGFIHKEKISNLYTILNYFTNNTSKIVLAMTSIIPDLFMTLISVAILFSISTQMTLVTLLLGIIISMSLTRLTRLSQFYGKKNVYAQLSINQLGLEILNGMSLIRLFGRGKEISNRYRDTVNDLRSAKYHQGLLGAAISPLATVLLAFTAVMLLLASTILLDKEVGFWLGILFVFLVVFARLGGPIARINLSRSQIFTLIPPAQALLEFFTRQDKKGLTDGSFESDQLKEEIRLENVSFRYGSSENNVLTDISFTIPKGKVTAIVGASGTGKSTLVALIGRLYDPTSGRILVDGKDLREFKLDSWHRGLGVVSQNIFLFNDTLRNNIIFGKPEATDKEIVEAVRKANAYQFIEKMPDKYQTVLGDRGVRLSGGQAQRVAIARAILVDPELLILDEATSSLDTEAERLVQEAIDKVSRNRTVLVVAHRLSTIRDADNIIVLEEGCVVERGTHQELISRKGRYWKYVQLQDLMKNKSLSSSD